MNIKEKNIVYIYESPDGGITLYRRLYGKYESRELYDKAKNLWNITRFIWKSQLGGSYKRQRRN